MEKMTLLEFLTWFYETQTREWLISEIIKIEMERGYDVRAYWSTYASTTCQIEIVN